MEPKGTFFLTHFDAASPNSPRKRMTAGFRTCGWYLHEAAGLEAPFRGLTPSLHCCSRDWRIPYLMAFAPASQLTAVRAD